MTEIAPERDNRIPLGVAICCREWIVPVGTQGGSCGLCGEKPKWDRLLPEGEWLTPTPPRNELLVETEEIA